MIMNSGTPGASLKTYMADIGTTWEDELNMMGQPTGAKTQTVLIDGINGDYTAFVDHNPMVQVGSYDSFVEQENQFLTCITNGFAYTITNVDGTGGIVFTIFGDANTVSIPIIVTAFKAPTNQGSQGTLGDLT